MKKIFWLICFLLFFSNLYAQEKVFEFKDRRVIEHFETIDAFLERNNIKALKEIDL